ncbi:MAG: CoA transferase subunit A, partial [Betaproteobacteria bacterium]|nr:CoA transferase subunit A [Betaproteobacteria bacterium]
MNKVFPSAAEAIADLPDGATVALGGFSVGHRFALGLIIALRDKGARNLTLVCNSMGAPGELRGQILAENHQVRKLIAAFTVRPGMPTATEAQIKSGEIEVELVPQGILVERCRAGGAGIPAFYTAAGADTELAQGKELRVFDGRPHVLETAIRLDYAFIRAHRADRAGNVQFRGGSQNLSPAFAKAANCA